MEYPDDEDAMLHVYDGVGNSHLLIMRGSTDAKLLDLDGVYNSVDCAIIRANAGMTNVGYSGGDVNCDGIVNVYDLRCPVDLNCDGVLDFFDVQAFLQSFSGGSMFVDYNGDGRLDFFDVQAFLQLFSAGCN